MDIRRMIALGILGGKSVEKIVPTCVVTSSALDPTPTAAIPVTFTWSEDVTGFAVEDITLGNCTIGDLTAVSASVYTATITAAATGTVSVDIAAGVCVDLAGNANAATTQFSIVYVLSVMFLMSDGSLFQDAAKTTPATANDHPIGNWEDQSGNGHDVTAVTTARPTLKTNIIGGLPGILFNGSSNKLDSASFDSGIGKYGVSGTKGYTLYILQNRSTNADRVLFARGTYAPAFYSYASAGSHNVKIYSGGNYAYTAVLDINPHVLAFRRLDGATATLNLWVDNVLDATSGAYDQNVWGDSVISIGSSGAAGQFHDNYIYGIILCAGTHTDAQVSAINEALKKKISTMISASFTINNTETLVYDGTNWFGNPTLTVL